MIKETIGMISGVFVVVSIIPYAVRTYQGKVHPVITSWALWSVIGLALLLSYKSSGAEDNVWPAVFGFFNPTLITILAIIRRGKGDKMTRFDKWCVFFCGTSLIMWLYMKDNRELVQFALYTAMAADFCAAFPTLGFLWREPHKDRPFAWSLFSIGYGIALFAIPQYTFANCALPVYMTVGSASIAGILIDYRVKTHSPLKEWI